MKRQKRAFTLIEIMLVIVMIGIMTAMVVPSFAGRTDLARTSAARMDIEANLAMALDLFEMDVGRYPTTDEGLKALVVRPGTLAQEVRWNGPYLRKRTIPQDPWGRTYVYASPGQHIPMSYDLASLGADGSRSDDDIVNWGDGAQEK